MSSQGTPFDLSHEKKILIHYFWTLKQAEVEFRMMKFLSLLSSAEYNMGLEQRKTKGLQYIGKFNREPSARWFESIGTRLVTVKVKFSNT